MIDGRKNFSIKTLPLTSDFPTMFPRLRGQKKNLRKGPLFRDTSSPCLGNNLFQIDLWCNERNASEDDSEAKGRLKSVIVVNHFKSPELSQGNKVIVK